MNITAGRVLGMLAAAAAFIGVPSVWMSRMLKNMPGQSPTISMRAVLRSRWRAAEIPWRLLRWQFGPGSAAGEAWPEWAASRMPIPRRRGAGDKVRLSFVGHAAG